MDKPYIVDVGKLEADLREVFKRHGWEPGDAYDLAREVAEMVLAETG